MIDKIKFFSVYDLSIGSYIDKLKEKLDLFNSNIEYNDNNDILELRNKYAHGAHSTDEMQHFNDYFKFLEILVLIIIKINEEFCLYDDLKNNL